MKGLTGFAASAGVWFSPQPEIPDQAASNSQSDKGLPTVHEINQTNG